MRQTKSKRKNVIRDCLIYKAGNRKRNKRYDFQKFKIIQSFIKDIWIYTVLLDPPHEEQLSKGKKMKLIKIILLDQNVEGKKKSLTNEMEKNFLQENKKLLMLLRTKYF